jgi:hypothetical protein
MRLMKPFAKVLSTELLDLAGAVAVGECSSACKRRFAPVPEVRLQAETKPHNFVRERCNLSFLSSARGDYGQVINMATNLREMPTTHQPTTQRDGRFYKVQIKGWVDFDPTGRGLGDIVNVLRTSQPPIEF